MGRSAWRRLGWMFLGVGGTMWSPAVGSAEPAPLVVIVESEAGLRPAVFRRELARGIERPVRSFARHGTADAWALLLVALAPRGCKARLRLRTRGGRVFEALYLERVCRRAPRVARLAKFTIRFVRKAERSVLSEGERPLPVFSELIDPWSPLRVAASRSRRVRSDPDWLVSPMGELLDPFAVRPGRPASVPASVHDVADPWRGRGGLNRASRLTPPRRASPRRTRRRH